MAKNIKIRMGNQKQVLSDVKYLEVLGGDGEPQRWVCEDDILLTNCFDRGVGVHRPSAPFTGYKSAQIDYIIGEDVPPLGVLEVTENGIYKASGDPEGPFRGYSKVIVNVNRRNIYPSSIAVTRYPDKMQYLPYEPFDYEGIEVSAYQDDKLVWNSDGYSNGVIPLDELTLIVNYAGRYAEYDGITFKYEIGVDTVTYTNDKTGEILYEITVDSGSGQFYTAEIFGLDDSGEESEYKSTMALLSKSPFTVTIHDYSDGSTQTDSAELDTSMGSDVYIYSMEISQDSVPGHCSAPRNYAEDNYSQSEYGWDYAGYVILYGTKSVVNNNTVDVLWATLGSGHVYTTSFGFTIDQ